MPDGGVGEAIVADALLAEVGTEAAVGAASTVEAGAAADAFMTGGISGELAGAGIGSAVDTIASMVGTDTAGTVVGSAADASMTGGIPGTVTSGAANTAATGVEAAKYGTLADGASSGIEAVNAPAATDVASSAPGTREATDAAFGNGAGAAQTATDDGIIAWAKANPKLAAPLIQGAGLTMAGAAKGALDYAGAEKKAELDRETLLSIQRQKPLLYAQFVQQSGAGGGGVVMPFGAPAQRRPLTNSAGQPVFGQGGIIGSRLGA